MSSENASQTFAKIYKSRNILLELLKHSGYNIDDYHGFSSSMLNSMIETKQLDMLLNNEKNQTKAYVKYQNILSKTLKAQNVNNMIEDLYDMENILNKEDTLIIITNDEPNDTLKTHIKTLWEEDHIFIVVFNIRRLQFNILEHEMVPPHKILGQDEVKQFKQYYNISMDNQLPTISRFDPVSLCIFMKPNEICEVERPSKTSITTKYYRICVNQ